ncbi:enoyl-CoA hydratase-related protein [Sulfitobacter geojensis]|uniref:Enoyl-CoA hydratase/isomerase family protein n=1 Tax=Sulfitobacter geojensis TaxID=1342299 RepID=A0AAE3B5J2_9RHOB|nr:enoyl-CoA hydratase-related protein [Sulfitobacter geojensis]MBM1687995.1 enoyl-CoA hydratase/isomerase family protein [Sulfitobacter geojensis]MBM1692062.1 enoyl-CoA hydratase/isomerase family protein [Sulfitobacter geojensis]MBM1704228.1 enoyl-CoA hydratase/isomerase family protein [Sulfitobacter geojensis]MBM1708286.1 enoyl-CoA hydratase/isomerase family protein [Sulfitobacter geojensis]MBM1712351.1 enoyl-CoA hydratase/isomerase family protein [Sulfitobacter geojensis]
MDYQTITYSVENDIATLTLSRADKMNALTTQMRAEITHAATQAGKDARVLVLTGAGNAFCSGQDLGNRTAGTSVDMERSLRDEYAPMLRAIVNCPIPTIAAVNGPAAGAGASLALAADVVIATESAYFLQAFTRIGLIPDAGGTYVLPRTMGTAKAMGAALFADKISARQADDWGMIWEAVPDADFDANWRGKAAHLASGPTTAYAQVKNVIRGSWDNTLEEQLTLEAQSQGTCGKSRDFQEGVLAFTEKRPAKFEGR